MQMDPHLLPSKKAFYAFNVMTHVPNGGLFPLRRSDALLCLHCLHIQTMCTFSVIILVSVIFCQSTIQYFL